jgi:peptidoglycan/LPS O-acetylase OafA/YrhL
MEWEVGTTDATADRVEALDALTSLRFFAALLVLSFHYHLAFFDNQSKVPLVSLGYTGVTFFFILSGFILSHNYARTRFDHESLYRFTVARIARIYPSFLLSLAVALPTFIGQIAVSPSWLKLLLASSVILAPIGLHAWVPGAACGLNCPTWSISAEIFFYAAFPLLMPLVLKRPFLWLLATGLAWLTMCLAFLELWHVVAEDGPIVLSKVWLGPVPFFLAQFIKFFPIARLPEFVLGIVVYKLWRDYGDRFPTWLALTAFLLATVVLVALEGRIPELIMHDGLTALAWVPLIVAAANMHRGPLNHRAAIFLGQISFNLYLLHIPVLYAVMSFDRRVLGAMLANMPWVGVLAAAAISFAAAAAAFRYVEEPCRRAIRRAMLQRGTA